MSKKECTCSSFVLQYEGCLCGFESADAERRRKADKKRIINEYVGTHTFPSIKCNIHICVHWGHDVGDGHCTYPEGIELSGDIELGTLECLTFDKRCQENGS